MSDILLDQQELIIDQQVVNDMQYQIDQFEIDQCLPELPLDQQFDDYNQVLNNQQDTYPSQPMNYVPPSDSQDNAVQDNLQEQEQIRGNEQPVEQNEVVQNQKQQQEQIVQLQEPPEHIMIEDDQVDGDSQPHVVEFQKPATKTFIFNKYVTNPKHWRLMMKPHAKVLKRNYYHNYRIDVLGKKLCKQIKKKSANDQLNWIFQKLKYEKGIKFDNYTRKIRVITPISDTKYMHYQKKLQVMKKIRALLTIKLNIEGQRQDALEPVPQQFNQTLNIDQNRALVPSISANQTQQNKRGRKLPLQPGSLINGNKSLQPVNLNLAGISNSSKKPGRPPMQQQQVNLQKPFNPITPVISKPQTAMATQLSSQFNFQDQFKHIKNLIDKKFHDDKTGKSKGAPTQNSMSKITQPGQQIATKTTPVVNGKKGRPRGRPVTNLLGKALGQLQNQGMQNQRFNQTNDSFGQLGRDNQSLVKKDGVLKWRDMLFIQQNMSKDQMIQSLNKFFSQINSYEFEPGNLRVRMEDEEAKDLKQIVEKAIKWLVEKIIQAKMKPIVVTLNSSGESNQDIIKAFSDRRYMSNVHSLIENSAKVFLTPKFLDHFDFNNALDKPYLKNKVKFMSAMLGFQATTNAAKYKGLQQNVPFRCYVGNSQWHQARERKFGPDFRHPDNINFNVGACPFFVEYSREMDNKGNMIGPYKLNRFEFTHSHPLTMEYERVLLE